MNNKAADQTALVHRLAHLPLCCSHPTNSGFFTSRPIQNQSVIRVTTGFVRNLVELIVALIYKAHFFWLVFFCVFFTLILQFKDTYQCNETDVSLYHESFIVLSLKQQKLISSSFL